MMRKGIFFGIKNFPGTNNDRGRKKRLRKEAMHIICIDGKKNK
jgi:hypothetical protein